MGGVYYLPTRWWKEEASEVNYKTMTFKVSLGDYGVFKSPSENFFEGTFAKDLSEEELGNRRSKFLIGPSIAQKVEDEIAEKILICIKE